MAQHTGQVNALCALWSFERAIIEKVFLGLGGNSMDEADEYLNLMDGEESHDPAECWEEWQRMHNLHHEPNPFKEEKQLIYYNLINNEPIERGNLTKYGYYTKVYLYTEKVIFKFHHLEPHAMARVIAHCNENGDNYFEDDSIYIGTSEGAFIREAKEDEIKLLKWTRRKN